MTWNYRIIHHDQDDPEWFGLHEVYYDGAGRVEGWTEAPVEFVADTREEMLGDLYDDFQDAKNQDVLVESQTVRVGFGMTDEEDEDAAVLPSDD